MSVAFDTSGVNMKEALETANDDINDEKLASAHGWDARVPLNYEHINATREETEVLIESGAVQGWAANAVRYEWNDEYGDVGPKHEGLEKQLFNKDFTPTVGDNIRTLTDFKVTQEGESQVRPIKNFEEAGLHPAMVDNVRMCHYYDPTPVQAYAIPAVLQGFDVIAVSQTGSGKTAAYMIPVLSKLMGKVKKLAAPRPNPARYNKETDRVRAEPLVLILCPTRELATQIFDEARRLCYRTMLRPCVVYGGGPKRAQIDELERGCDVLIGTPGRLRDIIVNSPRVVTLTRLKFTIIDEADELLGADWEEELKDIVGGGASQDDGDHQYMMFSATFPKAARELAKQYMSDNHVRIRVGRAGSAHMNVVQVIVEVISELKQRALLDLLLSLPPCRTIIFVNSTHTADITDDFLYNKNFPCTSIHSGRTQREREDATRAFRTGTCPILVTTGVSARGMDIKNVMHIINYDLPSAEHGGIDEYVHRIGRTARIGNVGRATSFYNSDRDEGMARNIVKVLLECKQGIPKFLAEFMPDDQIVTWDDDTDDEGETNKAGDGGQGWGQEGGVPVGLGAGLADIVEKTSSSGWINASGASTSASADASAGASTGW